MAYDENQLATIVVPLILWVMATVALILRLIARRVRLMPYDLSDLLVVLAWVLLLGVAAVNVAFVTLGGSGRHIQTLTPQELRNFFALFYAGQLIYFVISPVLKASFVVFYRKLFPTGAMRLATTIVLCLLSSWGVAIVLAGLFQCRPISKAWNPMQPGTCIELTPFLYAIQAINIVFDCTIFIMPLPVLWGIQRPLRHRLALIGLFGLGGFGVAAAIVRAVALGDIDPTDLTYNSFEAAIWTSVEPSVGVVCASLPIIRGLFSKKYTGTTQRVYRSTGGGGGNSSNTMRGSDHRTVKEGCEMGPYRVMVSHDISVETNSL